MTAAHCLGWTAEGWMALGDNRFRETIITAAGQSLVAQPCAVEPVSDLAVLGAVDGQEFADEADAFEDFCATTKPVRLATQGFEVAVLSAPTCSRTIRGSSPPGSPSGLSGSQRSPSRSLQALTVVPPAGRS